MKKLLLALAATALTTAGTTAQTTDSLTIGDKGCTIVKLQQRQIGPGTVYTRYRVPEFPLNINLVCVDVTNPYIKIETSLPNDRSAGTELLVNAAKRYDSENHHAIAAQNANFWIVSSNVRWNAYGASTNNVNLRNGMMAIDSKSFPNYWWWTTEKAGIIAATATNELFIDRCRAEMTYTTEKLGKRDLINCNKGFAPGQTSFYTPWFGPDRQFIPLIDDTNFVVDENSDCTEVMLRLAEGETWSAGRDINFVVAEVRATKGRGVLGDYDLAIVSRDADLAKLAPGDKLALNYGWIFNRDGSDVRPLIDQAVGGNMMVMRNGEITEENEWDSYDTMVYSRSAYGASKDNNTLFMMTIDKSIDPVYGSSIGCTTAEMCDIMRHLGAWNVINVDAGGSAELMVDGAIINHTTEGTPRAVGNGWMIFNTAPDTDTTIASLEFYDVTLSVPTGAMYSPRVIAFNQYGTQITDDYRDYTIVDDDFTGKGHGNTLIAGPNAGKGTLTITTADGITASKDIELYESERALRRPSVVIDKKHDYRIEIVSEIDGKSYTYDPSTTAWATTASDVATIDEDGVIHAGNNGTTTVTGRNGNNDMTLTVNVENCDDATRPLYDDWTQWTAKGNTGISGVKMGADGTINYTYGSPRGLATLTLTHQTTVYGLPTSVVIEFTPSTDVRNVELNLTPYGGTGQAFLKIEPDSGFVANEPAVAQFDISQLGDINAVDIYPLSFKTLRFSTTANTKYRGAQTLKITGFYARYDGKQDVADITVDNDTELTLSPLPAAPGTALTITASRALQYVEVYTLGGALLSRTPAPDTTATIVAPAAGTYLVRTAAGTRLLPVR